MEIGIAIRNMGDLATGPILAESARSAEAAGLESLWVTDHVAIPPDQSEGSNGRYLDPLATLAFLSGQTERIGLGTAVLILPYRPPLPTAKWVATVQELSGGRLQLGVGVGWMKAEFDALGIERTRRGRDTDHTLAFLKACFADDEMEANGQRFLFRPRPVPPPILIGGAGPHALRRAIQFGDGWLPVRMPPEQLETQMGELGRLAAAASRPPPQVVVMNNLPLGDGGAAPELLAAYRSLGVARVIHAGRYDDQAACENAIAQLARFVETE